MTLKPQTFKIIAIIIAIIVTSYFITTDRAQADGQYPYSQPTSYDLSDYGVVPVKDVANHLHEHTNGIILKIKLDTKKDPWNWRYKSKVLLPDGRILRVEHDARTLAVMKYKIKS